ncbi:TPA: ATP-dependent RNA helicase HrpA, partial [Mannheimia haemolytica]|nr:ATP-dependent RNA helicase HrpA [Mannheimia haemolytica]
METPLQKNHKKPPLVKLENITTADFRRLLGRLKGAENIKNIDHKRSVLAEISQDLTACQARFFARTQHAQNLKIDYPDLPVSARREEILKLISENQVVVIAGETGSGKTTQLPKMCLELGRGVKGLIGHTQPRRIAARSVATRIAEELKSELGETVGYKVRFNDQVSENSLIKLMTDGILLAEIQHDSYLNQYDTLIIDEAHERSLNNDFILGYLKQILHKRPDLKVIITSATIDVERFSKHFNNAPIIEVSGRTFPVEVRYRPIVEDQDQLQGILNAVDELQAEGRGDILIFMNGEREIRDTAEALQKQELRHSEILPLYARLSAAEQQRIFQPSGGLNRIILATNVAETSLTIPNIKYVIDTGTARISRYSYRTKVQRLPIEPISQASANQRKGRCGRTSEGICIRLYSEEDFNSRPQFTDPEILRTNLAAVILQMTSLGLSDIANFPFVDAPDSRQIQDGIRLLEELQAIIPNEKIPSTACGGGLGRGEIRSNDGTPPLPTSPRKRGDGFRLTPIGRQLAQLPVDPRLGRMVIE